MLVQGGHFWSLDFVSSVLGLRALDRACWVKSSGVQD